MRYLALRWGSQKYHEMWGEGKGKSDVDVKLGGNQIEYEDEDPIVPQMFQEACVKAGVKNLMEKYYKIGVTNHLECIMIRRTVSLLGLSFLLLSDSFSTNGQAQLTKVNVASSGISPTQLPPYMAQDAGAYSKNGLDVSIIRTRPEIAVMSLLGAEASIIHIGGAITIRSNLRGADLAFIAAGAVATDYWTTPSCV